MVAKSARKTSANGHCVSMLQKAYRMELETVINYLSNSVHLDGMLAEEVKRALNGDIAEELGHAQRLAHRIKQLGGRVPGSLELEFDQNTLRPPETTTDVRSVVEGVIDAESSAIDHYREVIEQAEADNDPVTANLVTDLLSDEVEHLTVFEGFRRDMNGAGKQ